jgi:hypothetical protein
MMRVSASGTAFAAEHLPFLVASGKGTSPASARRLGGLWWPMFRMALVQTRAAGGLLGGICGGGALELADGVGALAPRSGSRFS